MAHGNHGIPSPETDAILAREIPGVRYHYLHDIATGRVFNSAPMYGLSQMDGTLWEWTAASVAAEYGCRLSEVGCTETDDGDSITARGEAVARREVG